MKIREASAFSGRSENWLRRNSCAWCGQTLLRSLTVGCGAMFDRCDPKARDYRNMKHVEQLTNDHSERDGERAKKYPQNQRVK